MLVLRYLQAKIERELFANIKHIPVTCRRTTNIPTIVFAVTHEITSCISYYLN